MEGQAISATIGVLVQNLITVWAGEISLIWGVEENADKLKGTLATIQNSLDDAQKKFITDDAVKRWLKELENVAFDADNIVDELDYKIISKKMKKRSCFPSFFDRYIHRREMALSIININTIFESIDKRATMLGLETRLADAPTGPDTAAWETDSFTVDPIFIGRDDDVSKIVEKLTTSTEDALSILPIVGMGGLGKTTLARKVFNHEKTKTYFGLHIWVHVSQNFDAVTLFKKILISLKPEIANQVEINREGLLKMIQEALATKTYVLVLDDVWNQDRQKWEDFLNSWSGVTSVKGNRILVRTRNTQVGMIVKTSGIYELDGLSESECWSIIKDKTFKGGDISLGFEAIGRSIAERCHGLPLAANVVGGVLRDKSLDEWRKIKENWLSDVGEDENNIIRILRLSYDHLSSLPLKKCFSYCSVYLKGSKIGREDLIQSWMAEGFLQPSATSDMESVGNNFVNILVQSSLLQVADRDIFTNEERCIMHDLVHDVAFSVLGFSKVNNNTPDDIYLNRYILWESDGDESSRIMKEQSKWLRTLLYNGDIHDIIFSNFKSLHVLILVGYNIVDLSDSIGKLIHLRFLNISKTSIENLPRSIGKLYHLQTFKARDWYTFLTKLPSTFKYLSNLRHLDLREETKLPPHVGMLTSLQTLRYFKVRDEDGYQILELGSLKNLKGSLTIDNLEKVADEDESKKACLLQKSGIIKLVLSWDVSREGAVNDQNVLRGLQPHSNLKILQISAFKGASFPSWTLKMEGFDNLMEIKLESCSECEEVPTLGHLPHLNSIYLSNLENVKSISTSFYGTANNAFPALETLEFFNMPKLSEWKDANIPNESEMKVFPCLKILRIEYCNILKSAPSTFRRLKDLFISDVDSGVPLANICGINLTSLVQLNINRVVEMVSLPDWLFHNNQNLSVLEIKDCNELRELPDGLQTLNSLEQLAIEYCDNLNSIQISSEQQSQGLTLLRKLTICTRTCINVPCALLWSSLKELELRGRVTNMPMVIECMHKMPRLTELRMTSVSKFMIPSLTKLGSLRSLKTLEFSPDDSMDCVSDNAVDGILRMGSQSLQRLVLTGRKDWESLPDQLQHLIALKELTLLDLEIEELSEWFGNLSSLQSLEIQRCGKLKRQPFVEAMQRLTNLTYLSIRNCPSLEEGGDIEQQIYVPNLYVNKGKLR